MGRRRACQVGVCAPWVQGTRPLSGRRGLEPPGGDGSGLSVLVLMHLAHLLSGTQRWHAYL